MAQEQGWNFGAGSGFTNNSATAGIGVINGVAQSIYTESSTQKAPLGQKLEFDDGRVFRYTKSGASIAIGLVCANDYSDGLLAETDNFSIDSDVAAGDTSFSLTGGGSEFATSANAYAGSYIVFSDGGGAGEYYRIKGHGAASSDKITFELFDKLGTAPTATTDIIIVGSPYGNTLTADGTSIAVDGDNWAIGVSPIAVTSGYYFWMQTRGVCSVKADYGTSAASLFLMGDQLVVSTSHDGQVEIKLDGHSDARQVVGNNISPSGDDNTFIPMWLDLE
jgi:hypothetical protein